MRQQVPKAASVEDSDDSQSSFPKPAPQKTKVDESYSSDGFDEVSASGSGSIGAKPVPAAQQSKLKKIEESSDLYEEDDFESLSRSQQQMNKLLPVAAKPVEKKPLATIAKIQQASAMPTIVRKENKQTMTDVGKYNYTNDPTSGASNMKEWQL